MCFLWFRLLLPVDSVTRTGTSVESAALASSLSGSPHQLVPRFLHSAAHSAVASFLALRPIICQTSGHIAGGRLVFLYLRAPRTSTSASLLSLSGFSSLSNIPPQRPQRCCPDRLSRPLGRPSQCRYRVYPRPQWLGHRIDQEVEEECTDFVDERRTQA